MSICSYVQSDHEKYEQRDFDIRSRFANTNLVDNKY